MSNWSSKPTAHLGVKGWKSDGVGQEVTLKIAAAQGLCAVAESIAMLPYYGGGEGYMELLTKSFLNAVSSVPRFLTAVCTVGIPSFGWPSVPSFDQVNSLQVCQ
jgi:hypothetical protein